MRTAGLHSLEIYKKAGVKIGYGSDLLGPSQRLQSDEFRIRAEVLSAQEVIQCATTTAAEVLDQVGHLGRSETGALADILLVDGNPYRDLSCLLGQGEHIPLIMKGGVIEHNALGV